MLHNLSMLLPNGLRVERDTVELAPVWELDTRAFVELEARGDEAALLAAVNLWRGELMEGVYLDDCPEFELWLTGERERWRQRVVRALNSLITNETIRRDYTRALDFASRLLTFEPWREETHRQVMLLLARTGQRSAALAQYETCRRILRDELGVAPAHETTRLYERLRAAEAMPAPNLPPQPTPFVGRAQELAQIANLINDPACRLLTLLGAGGIGKTRLALQAASATARAFLHGVYFVPVSSITSPELLVSTIAKALQFSFSNQPDPKTQLLKYLREKEMLLVLDSFEQLLSPAPSKAEGAAEGQVEGSNGANLLSEILENCQDVKIVVTCRERLNLRWERLFQVEGMKYPDCEWLDNPQARFPFSQSENTKAETPIGNPPFDSVQLFLQSARQAYPRFDLTQELRGAVRICQLVEGMPLGIEIAAAWVGIHSCEQIAQEIGRNLDFLTTYMRDAPKRHRSVRAAFDHSWNLLVEDEQQVFRRLSAFRGGFYLAAAERVTGASPAIISKLVDKSLLRRNPADRCEMHELLRQYAEEKMQAAGEAAITRTGHLNYFVTLAERIEPELEGPEQKVWLEQLEVEHDNLRAALDWSVGSEKAEAGLRLAGALWRFWEVRGHLTEGRKWLEGALARINGEVSPAARAKALFGAGHLSWCQSDLGKATARLTEGLALFRQLQDQRGAALVLNTLGLVARYQGDYARAIAAHEEGLALQRQRADKRGIASALGNLAIVFLYQGNHARARSLYDESLALFRELGDKQNTALALNNLGIIALEQEDYGRAVPLLQEALDLFRALGNKWGIAAALGNLANISKYQGDYGRATARYEEGLTLQRELGDKHAIAISVANLGSVAMQQRDYMHAAALYREGLALDWELEEKRDLAECLEGIAWLASVEQQMERAARLLGAAEALREATGAPLPPADRANYARVVSAVRQQLDAKILEKAWAQGRTMPLEQVVAYAAQKD